MAGVGKRRDEVAPIAPVTSGDALAAALLRGLMASRSPVDPGRNDLAFVEREKPRAEGGHRIQFDDWEHLREIYEDNSRFLVLMAGAQTGKTARIFTHIVRRMLLDYGSLFGYYVPTADLANNISDDRFRPFLMSMEHVAALVGQGTATTKGSDATKKRSLGASLVYFMTSFGLASTESVPLKGVYMDEVRRMEEGDIERIQQRYSAQTDPYDVKVSTASAPNTSIHKYFLRGTQRFFHTDTDHPDGYVLAKNFPECIADLRGATPLFRRKVEHAFSHAGRPLCGMSEQQRKQYPMACYIDHRTGHIITNPREGWWEAENPTAFVQSYHMSQILSVHWPAGRVLEAFEMNTDRQEFFNSCLGLPYIDEEQRLVHEEHLRACIVSEALWYGRMTRHWRKRNVRRCAMGVDCQAGYLVAVIKQQASDAPEEANPGPRGKFRTVHIEVVYQGSPKRVGNDPWRRLAELMDEYDVSVCVIDHEPHYNEALRFANAFRGRVWLAHYGAGPLVSWGDDVARKKKKVPDGETGRAGRQGVTINNIKGFRWSLGRWKQRMNEVPKPGELWQTLPRTSEGRAEFSAMLATGQWAPVDLALTYLWHQRCVVITNELASDREAVAQGKSKWIRIHVETDPHFAHANLYADFALDRMVNGMRLAEDGGGDDDG